MTITGDVAEGGGGPFITTYARLQEAGADSIPNWQATPQVVGYASQRLKVSGSPQQSDGGSKDVSNDPNLEKLMSIEGARAFQISKLLAITEKRPLLSCANWQLSP